MMGPENLVLGTVPSAEIAGGAASPASPAVAAALLPPLFPQRHFETALPPLSPQLATRHEQSHTFTLTVTVARQAAGATPTYIAIAMDDICR